MSEELARLFGTVNAGSAPALRSFQTGIARSNPYRMAALPVASAKFNMDTWTPGEALGVSAGQAFLAGVLQAMGDRREARQMEAVARVLPQLRADPLSVETPEGVDPQAFAGLKLDTAYQNEARDQAYIQDLFGVRLEELKAKAKRRGEIQGENEGYGVGAGGVNPNSPLYKLNQDMMKSEIDFKKDLMKRPAIAQLNATVSTLPELEEFASKDTSTSDVPFTYKLIQGLDGGVVKDGEIKMVQGTNPIFSKYSAAINSALNGGSGMTTKIKRQIVDELRSSARQLYEAFPEQFGSDLATADSYGFNRANIMPFNSAYLDEVLQPREWGASVSSEREALMAEKRALEAQMMNDLTGR